MVDGLGIQNIYTTNVLGGLARAPPDPSIYVGGSHPSHTSGSGGRCPHAIAGEELFERDGLRTATAIPSTLRRLSPFSLVFRRHHPRQADVGRGGCAGGISPTTTYAFTGPRA